MSSTMYNYVKPDRCFIAQSYKDIPALLTKLCAMAGSCDCSEKGSACLTSHAK